MVFMVPYTKFPFNDPRYTRTGPDLATKSIRLCAYGQLRRQQSQFLCRQLGSGPWLGTRLQPRFAFFANHLHPLPDRPRGNIQGFRDFFLGPSRVLEFHGAIPTLLFPIYVASTFFVHARSLSIIRYEGNLSMQRSINTCITGHCISSESPCHL